MSEETTTRKTTTRASKSTAVNLSETAAPWLRSSGIKVCGECGEKLCTRQDADGVTEIFCPANKSNCAFVKTATT